MEEQERNFITINQPVERSIYSKIKILAAMDNKKISDVVIDAFIYYAKMRGIK